MPSDNKSPIRKAVTAVVLCIIALVTVLYARGDFDITFIHRPEIEITIPLTPDSDTDTDTTETVPETQAPAETSAPEVPSEPEQQLTFEEQLAQFPDISTLSGYHITNTLLSGAVNKIAKITPKTEIPSVFSQRTGKVRTVTSETDARGNNNAKEEFTDAELPLLDVYFGYIIYNSDGGIKLCDSNLNILCDITGYERVGYCDLSGHPLFKKDGSYFYFYDGTNRKNGTIVLDEITPETANEYAGTPEPNGMWLLNTESEITPTLSKGRGMTECTVDENYFDDISANSTYYDRNTSGIYRLCEIRQVKEITNQWQIDDYNNAMAQRATDIANGIEVSPTEPTKVEPQYKILSESTHWWYVDKDGKTVSDGSYLRAFEYSADGYAYVIRELDEDKEYMTMTCVNKFSTVVFRAFTTSLQFAERGNAQVRDGHYLPDTLGAENTGMLRFDSGLCAVRRKLLDTTNGYKYISDKTALVNTNGEIFNLPVGYDVVGYRDGRILVSDGSKYGYMKNTGEWLTGMWYTSAQPFCEGIAVCSLGGKYGAINTNGTVVIPFMFDYMSQCSDGVIVACADGHGWSIFGKVTSEAEAEAEVNPILTMKRRLIADKVKADSEQASAN